MRLIDPEIPRAAAREAGEPVARAFPAHGLVVSDVTDLLTGKEHA